MVELNRPNPPVDPVPFVHWTLRDEAAQRRLCQTLGVMIPRSEISRVAWRVTIAATFVLSATGCQTNPMFWADGTKVDISSNGSFVVSLASERIASLGGPSSERAQEHILTSLKAKGCVPTAPIEKGGYAWGGYWYAGGKCK